MKAFKHELAACQAAKHSDTHKPDQWQGVCFRCGAWRSCTVSEACGKPDDCPWVDPWSLCSKPGRHNGSDCVIQDLNAPVSVPCSDCGGTDHVRVWPALARPLASSPDKIAVTIGCDILCMFCWKARQRLN